MVHIPYSDFSDIWYTAQIMWFLSSLRCIGLQVLLSNEEQVTACCTGAHVIAWWCNSRSPLSSRFARCRPLSSR